MGGHLGCFYILAIVHNASVNVWMHMCFQFSVLGFSEKYPEVKLLDPSLSLVKPFFNICFVWYKYSYTSFYLFVCFHYQQISVLLWPMWLSWLEHKSAGSIPGRGICLSCRFKVHTRGHRLIFIPLPSPLSKINKHVLR